MDTKQRISHLLPLTSPKTCIWVISISAWTFNMIERAVTVLRYESFTILELAQALGMALGLVSLFILKPRMLKLSNEGQ